MFVGVWFTGDVVISNSSLALKLPSLAVTFTVTLPALLFAGVPLKARVAGLKLNQLGKLLPSDKVAV